MCSCCFYNIPHHLKNHNLIKKVCRFGCQSCFDWPHFTCFCPKKPFLTQKKLQLQLLNLSYFYRARHEELMVWRINENKPLHCVFNEVLQLGRKKEKGIQTCMGIKLDYYRLVAKCANQHTKPKLFYIILNIRFSKGSFQTLL